MNVLISMFCIGVSTGFFLPLSFYWLFSIHQAYVFGAVGGVLGVVLYFLPRVTFMRRLIQGLWIMIGMGLTAFLVQGFTESILLGPVASALGLIFAGVRYYKNKKFVA